VHEFKSCNTNYMAWVFSMKNAQKFYKEFVLEKGEEFFNSIAKKNHLTRNDQEYEDTKYYIFHLAEIFNLKKLDQILPDHDTTPYTLRDIFDEMLDHDVRGFINEESYYNAKNESNNIPNSSE